MKRSGTKAPVALKPSLKKSGAAISRAGVNVRRLDHWNGLAVDIEGNRVFLREISRVPPHRADRARQRRRAAMWMTCTNKSYDFAYSKDHTGVRGRFHHVTYAVNSREEVLIAADIFLENGCTSKPDRTSTPSSKLSSCMCTSQAEIAWKSPTPGARLILAPDWKPIRWTEAERKKGQAWGLKTIESFSHLRHAGRRSGERKNDAAPQGGHARIQAAPSASPASSRPSLRCRNVAGPAPRIFANHPSQRRPTTRKRLHHENGRGRARRRA